MTEANSVTEERWRGDFEGVYLLEAEYLSRSLLLLGQSMKLTDDLTDMVDSLKKQSNEAPEAEQSRLPIPLLDIIRYQFSMSVLACLRGHLSTSLVFARCMVEATGHATRLMRDPSLVDIWYANSNGGKPDKRYRDAFATAKLFPEGDANGKVLRERYAMFSLRTHPSALILSSHQIAAGKGLVFDYNDARAPSDVVKHYVLILDTFVVCLRALRSAWGTSLSLESLNNWDILFTSLCERIARHMAKLKTLCASQREPDSPQ
jgi:hypothetical protein